RQQAKKEEYQNFVEIKEETPAKTSLSLNDLNNLAPVDFRGKTLKVEKKNILGSEHDLEEGEDVKINNH
ncbi:MAG: hypothetical protein ACYC40_03335, partial [Patescibacteria group bacterium]